LLDVVREVFSVNAEDGSGSERIVGLGEVWRRLELVGELGGELRNIVGSRVSLDQEIVGRDGDGEEKQVLEDG
jgi:hypothetical protein